jgi:hypothetical protein
MDLWKEDLVGAIKEFLLLGVGTRKRLVENVTDWEH